MLWSGSTRYHDWRALDRETPRRMLARIREAGLIGPVDWFAEAPDEERRDVEHDDGTLAALLGREPPQATSHGFSAGGARPAPWEIHLLLAPYMEAEGEVRGYNMLNVRFSAAHFAGVDDSDALIDAFRSVHTAAETEVAFLHPHVRWTELSDPLTGAYGDPLTLGPLFRGVVWATFLGPRHLELFDIDRLNDLPAAEVEWTEGGGLFIRASADLRDATDPDVERTMFRLSERLRRARR